MGGTNLLLIMIMGHNVWSIKPNFKFRTPKCNQNFPCGTFLHLILRVELHVGLHHACNTLGGGRVINAIEIQQVYRCGGCKFFPGRDHRFLDFDDA